MAVDPPESGWESILRKTPQAVTITRLTDGRFVDVNEAFAALCGHAREDLLGKTVTEVGLWVRDADREALWRAARRYGLVCDQESEIRQGDGTIRTVRISALTVGTGDEPGLLAVVREVGNEERTATAPRDREQHLNAILSNLPVLVWKVDRHGIFVVAEGLSLAALGATPDQWLGRSVFDVFADVPPIPEYHRRALSGETLTKTVEVRGAVMEAWYCPLRDDSGEVEGVLGVATDVTERRRAERERDRFFEMSLDMLAIADFQGRLKDVNPAWERTLGFTAEELEGRGYLDFIHSDDHGEVMRRVQELIAGAASGASFHHLETRFIRKDGAQRWILWNATPFPDERLIYATGRDITERKLMELEIADARDAALEATRLKTAFLANMSHEIRTPLNVILGNAALLGDEVREQGFTGCDEILAAIDRAGRRLMSTIHDILDISKIEIGAFEVHPVVVEIAPLVERCVAETRVLAARKGLSLVAEIDEPEAVVVFDEHCLSAALTNLLQNAVKFTERGGVVVKLDRDDHGMLRLEVRDTGVGIDPAFTPHLFDRFVQEQSGPSRRFEGSGLGLALTRRYLEMNGATISVASEKGKGSVFRIHFPTRPADPGNHAG